MAISETARLERETEQTRAELEHTLDELRTRMSPAQLLDQATGYLRNSSGRAFLGNLRDEVVRNPVPITLIGAGVAWLAISGAIGRRANGAARLDPARDWGETAASADDLAGRGAASGTAWRARQAAEGWAQDARDAVSEMGETVSDSASALGDRVGTAYDETIGRAREAAGEVGETLRTGARKAGELYDDTVGGARRAAQKAADLGRSARDAVSPEGALMNFCREQPMLVAGIGIAIGAAIGAMLPQSRAETRIMGEASRNVRERVTEAAADTLGKVTGSKSDGAESSERTSQSEAGQKESREPSRGTPRFGEERVTPSEKTESGAWSTGEAVDQVERGMRQGRRSPSIDSEPQSAAPYAEAASSADFGEDDAKGRG